jgi:hypothetical protein
VWFGNWSFAVYVMGGLFLFGGGCWLLFDRTRPVFAES